MTYAFPDRGARRPAGPLHLTADRPRPSVPAPAAAPLPLPCHDARLLTGPQGTATILLDGQAYQLRITRAGKLILTK